MVDPGTLGTYLEDQAQIDRQGIAAIELPAEDMLAFWSAQLSGMLAFQASYKSAKGLRYRETGSPFPMGDALVLAAMMASKPPARIVEIGSGFSTACMLDAAEHFKLPNLRITCIEPYPDRLKGLLRDKDWGQVSLMECPLQAVPLEVFTELKANDILFIDSTHVLKTGSDVHYELFRILPILARGVIVHIHDCPYPFEYPKLWVYDQNYSWNEVYAVRAFLMYNSRFRVKFWASYFKERYTGEVRRDFSDFLKVSATSLWLTAG